MVTRGPAGRFRGRPVSFSAHPLQARRGLRRSPRLGAGRRRRSRRTGPGPPTCRSGRSPGCGPRSTRRAAAAPWSICAIGHVPGTPVAGSAFLPRAGVRATPDRCVAPDFEDQCPGPRGRTGPPQVNGAVHPTARTSPGRRARRADGGTPPEQGRYAAGRLSHRDLGRGHDRRIPEPTGRSRSPGNPPFPSASPNRLHVSIDRNRAKGLGPARWPEQAR